MTPGEGESRCSDVFASLHVFVGYMALNDWYRQVTRLIPKSHRLTCMTPGHLQGRIPASVTFPVDGEL